MDKTFNKLAKEINFEILDSFKEIKIEKACLEEESIFYLSFKIDKIIPANDMKIFLEHLNKNFKYKTKFNFNVVNPIFDIKEIKEYMSMIVKNFFMDIYLSKSILDFNFSIEKNNVKLIIPDLMNYKKICSYEERIKKVITKLGFLKLNISYELQEIEENILENEKNRILNESKNIFNNSSKENNNNKEEKEYVSKRTNGYEVVSSISELKNGFHNNVIVKGIIFNIDKKETKNGWVITTISISDYKDAIYLKQFYKQEDKNRQLKLEQNMNIEVSGNYQIDKYSKEYVINIKKIRILNNDKNEIMDSSSKKRVEFSTRTRMSTMDGIVSPAELIQKAKQWGHKAIAISDMDSVQAFPDFFHASKNSGVKPIYGASLSVISKYSNAIYWPKNNNLLEDTYIVFDLETTGLSPEYEDIIEFGATKIVNGKITETKQFFVKPTKSIPKIITEITSITDEDVENAKPESESILDIRNYLMQGTIVAHNANFDITFVNSKLKKYGYDPIFIPTIDTLVVSRIVFPKAKRFRLETVALKYSISYDPSVAHRADYDADVLARIWIRMMNDLKGINIIDQKELFEFCPDSLYERKFTKEIKMIAKNQKGLKELFHYISLGLTKQFYKGPKLFFEDLVNRKEVLLCSGSLKSRLVEKMIYGSKFQVKEEISHYDVIEVQPLINFSHIINRGFLKENLENMITFVVKEAKKQGKIVIATGDVRYVDKKDKIYHEVYINAKGLGGKRHYLFKFNEENPIYPVQHFMTTNELMQEFNFLNDIKLIKEIVIENTNKIADMIEEIEVIKKELYTPSFGDSDKQLSELVYRNAKNKYGDKLPKIIEDRIIRELTPIKKYGFSVIYWISYLLVKKSLKDGYLVGSRGSVGSSFVATMSEITEVNPLQAHYVCPKCKHSIFPKKYASLNSGYDLEQKNCIKCDTPYLKEGQNIPFETFLGFEADKVPDIDLNFSGVYQSKIHNEVKKIFGETHAFRAGTISTVAEKTAFGYVKAWSEEKNKEVSKPFIEFLAKKVAGTKRTTGQHPGGIIVIPKEYDVEDFSPINFPANDDKSLWKTTHFDFHAIHDNVLKLDLLGHDDPTAIKFLEELTGVNAQKDIPFSDKKIISLFSSPKELGIESKDINGEKTGAMGIPEFGTKFVRGMLKNAKVSSFGDLIAISGLSHGTNVWTNNAEELIKNNKLTLNELISCRDNIMIDLINKKIEPIIAFNIMEKVRKGKGVTEEEEKIMKEHNVQDWYIESLKKIKYMFPKAHATAYVMMAWRIAWFKLYYPLAYYATYFTTRSDVFDIETIIQGKEKIKIKLLDFESRRYKWGSDKLTNKEVDLIPIYELALEAIARGIVIENINIEKSYATDWIIDKENNSLIPPFNSLDGLGDTIAESIVTARKEKEFCSIEDLKRRSSINKTHIEKFKEMKILSNLSETNQISFNLF